MESPLLGIQLDTELVNMLRVTYSDPLPAPIVTEEDGVKVYTAVNAVLEGSPSPNRLQITITNEVPQIAVSSLEEAEDLVVKFYTEQEHTTVFDPSRVSGENVELADAYAALSILINMAANRIAACTRRATGNVVLVNPEDEKYLRLASTSAFSSGSLPDEPVATIGRWSQIGTLNQTIKVYSGPVPKNKVVVLYIGSSKEDAPAIYSEYEGQGWLTWALSKSTTMGNAEDFGRVITIEDNTNGN